MLFLFAKKHELVEVIMGIIDVRGPASSASRDQFEITFAERSNQSAIIECEI